MHSAFGVISASCRAFLYCADSLYANGLSRFTRSPTHVMHPNTRPWTVTAPALLLALVGVCAPLAVVWTTPTRGLDPRTVALTGGVVCLLAALLLWRRLCRAAQLQADLDEARRQLSAERAARKQEEAAAALRYAELERQAQDERAELEVLYATAPIGLCVLDRELRWLRINGHLAELNGFPASAHLGHSVYDLLPDLAPQARQIIHQVMDSGEPLHGVEVRGETPARPGQERIWIEHFNPLRNRHGEVIAVNVVCQEVTEQVRAETALLEADRRKDEFLATLAHELRNPLAPLRSGLDILQRTPAGSAAALRAQEMMARQLGHMVHLIDDLMDVSRIRTGKLELRRRRVALQEVIDTAMESSRPRLDAAHHRLTVSVPAEPLAVDADPVRLAQVLSNLVNNAAKYTSPGGRIEITAQAVDDRARIQVTDNGMGIPPSMLPHVFDLFTQVGHHAEHAQGGLGIGLALARQLVALHGGSLEAHSAGPGQGSTFTILLPRQPGVSHMATQPPVPPPPSAVTAPAPSPILIDRAALPLRVLIADDNLDAGATLAMLLELEGAVTRTVGNGPAALAELEAFQPHLLFCDIGMPGLDGHEVARRVRADPTHQRTVLIAVSGWGSDHDKQHAREAGFDGHLTKPVDADSLRALLRAHGLPG